MRVYKSIWTFVDVTHVGPSQDILLLLGDKSFQFNTISPRDVWRQSMAGWLKVSAIEKTTKDPGSILANIFKDYKLN